MDRFSLNSKGSPREGALKIYFSCHQADFQGYFTALSDTVIAAGNCILYYADPEIPRTPEFLDALGSTKLFLMPVTARLLREPNAAMEAELPYALQHHIPVLPILMEAGLYEEFNRRFAHRHCLDIRNAQFMPQLEAFLQTMIYDEQKLRDIRREFEAKIFLSYRKKDRQQAKELIHLVRQNDFCRDMSIWFDDYLIPGENFDDAIQEQILGSDLFLLALTPSVLENPNYVTDHEIPAAQDSSRPILAAQLEAGDFDSLYRRFADLPATTDAHSPGSLTLALQSALKTVSPGERNNDPKHCYQIGLAYLNGIQVEIDPQMAEKLLRQAAEGGYEPAMEKLTEMYTYGDGVERSWEKAILWKRQLNAQVYSRMLETKQTLLRLEKELSQTRSRIPMILYDYHRAIRANRSILAGIAFDWCKKQVQLAALHQKNNDSAAAREVLQEAISCLRENQAHFDDPMISVVNERNTVLEEVYVALADCYMEAGDLPGAEQCLAQLRQAIEESSESEEGKQLSLVRVELEYGKLLYHRGFYAQAESLADRLLEQNRELLLPNSSPENLFSVFSTADQRYGLLRDYGILYGRITTALEKFRDAISGYQLAVTANQSMVNHRDWQKHFFCEFRIVECLCALGDHAQARNKWDALARSIHEEHTHAREYALWCRELSALESQIQSL